MVSPEDAFVVIAELSLALAGFTGVVSAFGGRERAFNEVEQMRLGMILLSSGGALAGCLLLFVVSAGGLSAATAYKTVGVSMVLIRAATFFRINRGILGNLRDPDTTISANSFLFGLAWSLVVLGFYVAAVAMGGEAWPLLAGFSLQLIFGLLVFARSSPLRIDLRPGQLAAPSHSNPLNRKGPCPRERRPPQFPVGCRREGRLGYPGD